MGLGDDEITLTFTNKEALALLAVVGMGAEAIVFDPSLISAYKPEKDFLKALNSAMLKMTEKILDPTFRPENG